MNQSPFVARCARKTWTGPSSPLSRVRPTYHINLRKLGGEGFQLAGDPDSTVENRPINHRRAIWLNHEAITKERETRRRVKMAAEEAKREKKARKEEAQSGGAGKKKAPPRKAASNHVGEAAGDTLLVSGPTFATVERRCGNRSCHTPRSEASAWAHCKNCNIYFCEREVCQCMYQFHQTTCQK